MRKTYSLLVALMLSLNMAAQGWPEQYGGVMLQGFAWDSYADSRWSVITEQAGFAMRAPLAASRICAR